MDNKIMKELPNGMILTAESNNNPDYPGIQISLKGAKSNNSDETLCFVEFNPEKEKGKELCICAYTHDQEDYVYYASYHDADGAKIAK